MSKWEKGQSGNPAGNKKTAFKDDFDNLLAKKKMHDEGVQIVADKWADIIEAMANIAIKGNVQAAVFLRDTFIGKPKETISHDISEDAKQGLTLAYSIKAKA
jgi:hypothetical protein